MIEGVLIFGLGAHPPDDATVETLSALESCWRVYCDLGDASHWRWLRRYCPQLRRPKSAAQILAAARRRPGVGLAVWGHPRYTSSLARQVEALGRKQGVSTRVFPAQSPISVVLARARIFLGGDEGFQGIQAYSLDGLLDHPDWLVTRLPAVVFSERGLRQDWERVKKRLAKKYPNGCRFYPQASGVALILPGAGSR